MVTQFLIKLKSALICENIIYFETSKNFLKHHLFRNKWSKIHYALRNNDCGKYNIEILKLIRYTEILWDND